MANNELLRTSEKNPEERERVDLPSSEELVEEQKILSPQESRSEEFAENSPMDLGIQKTEPTPERNIRESETAKSELLLGIENIMSEGRISELYVELTPDIQNEFKVEGEKTSREIENASLKGELTENILHDLMEKWLTIIPDINKYFIATEVLVRSKKIMELIESYADKNTV